MPFSRPGEVEVISAPVEIKENKEINATDKNITFDSIISNFKDSGDFGLKSKAIVLGGLKETLSSKNLDSVNSILLDIFKTKDIDKINLYFSKLEVIALKYEVEKEKSKQKASEEGVELSEDVLNAPEIKDPEEFIKSLLESNKGYIDGSLTKVNEAVAKADNMSVEEVGEMLYGNKIESPFNESWNIFDVEPEEWDLYFKKHNIPKVKQNQLRKYFSKLIDNKDFGNTITDILGSDFGTKISNEAKRIQYLGNDELIKINIKELNPSSGDIEFKTKKEALLYLYYNKILLREVATFIEDIIVGTKNIGNLIIGIGELIWNHFSEIIMGVIIYMGINTSGTVFRKVSATIIRKQIPVIDKLAVGEYLRKSTSPLEGEESREAAELKEREKYIELLEDKYKGNSEKLKEISSAKKYIRVLDHNIDSSEEDVNRLDEIKEKISERKEKLEGSENKQTNKRLKKEISDLNKHKSKLKSKLYRFSESTFWRKILHIEGGKWHQGAYLDTILKPWLLNTESNTMDSLNDSKKLIKEVQKEIFDESGKKIGILKQAENFIKRSHEVPNNKENEIKKVFNEYSTKLKKGEFGNIEGSDKKEQLNSIKSKILEEIESKTGIKLESRIFTEGNNLDNAKDFFFDGFKDFEPERGTNKKNKWVENLFEDDIIDSKKLNEIKKFFAEIQKSDNEYNRRTALDIISRIINDDLDYKTAINDSFKTSWTEIKKINIDSDFRGSLSNLVELGVKEAELEEKIVPEIETKDLDIDNKIDQGKTNPSKEKLTTEEKKKVSELYERAIKQAELNGKYTIADDFYKEFRKVNMKMRSGEELTINTADLKKGLENDVGRLGALSTLNKKIKVKTNDIFKKLSNHGLLRANNDGSFEFKGTMDDLENKLKELGDVDFLKYIVKALKTGS